MDNVREKLEAKISDLMKQRDELQAQLNATQGALQALAWIMAELPAAPEVTTEDEHG